MRSPLSFRKNGEQPGALTTPPASDAATPAATSATAPPDNAETIDLERRRGQLAAKVAEMQWDLGGLTYEMAIRNRLRPDVIVERAAALQEVDAELGEVERILRMERTGVAALCRTCGAPHSAGAVFCWQCGGNLLEQVPGTRIAATSPSP